MFCRTTSLISSEIDPIPRGRLQLRRSRHALSGEQPPQVRRHADVRRAATSTTARASTSTAISPGGRRRTSARRSATTTTRSSCRKAISRPGSCGSASTSCSRRDFAREPRAVRQRLALGGRQRAAALDPRAGARAVLRREPGLNHELEPDLVDREFHTVQTDSTIKMNYTFRF